MSSWRSWRLGGSMAYTGTPVWRGSSCSTTTHETSGSPGETFQRCCSRWRNRDLQRLPALDLAVVVIYLVALTAYGCRFFKKQRDSEEFMAAGRSLPGWAVGLSIFGSYVSSISFLANPGKAYGG